MSALGSFGIRGFGVFGGQLHPRSAQRLAVQRRARRTSGSLMLHQCHGGGFVRCNGLLGGGPCHPSIG